MANTGYMKEVTYVPGETLPYVRYVPDPDYDPTPWCSGCNAMRKVDCKCGPIAENE